MKRNPVTNNLKAPDLRPKPCIVWIDEEYKVDLSSFSRFTQSFYPLAKLAIHGYEEFVPFAPDDHQKLQQAIFAEVWEKRARLVKSKKRLEFVIHLMVSQIDAYCQAKGWQKQVTQMRAAWNEGRASVQHETTEQVNEKLFG